MAKTYKCASKHCTHEFIINNGDEYMKIGNRYYHLDCGHEKLVVDDIIAIFVEQINSNISIPILRNVINTLVHKQNYEIDYVFYAIKYAVAHPEFKLTYPQGLYRVVKDVNILNTWKEKVSKEMLKTETFDISAIKNNEKSFTYTKPKEKTIGSMFG